VLYYEEPKKREGDDVLDDHFRPHTKTIVGGWEETEQPRENSRVPNISIR
jgi:hypothetical protein